MSNAIRVLFVDDETDFVTYMKKRLEQRGFEVTAFGNPVEALERTQDMRFDLALLDLKMPALDGEELLHRLKARDPAMEIIMLTAHGTARSAFRTCRDGAYDYLAKPCEMDDLVGRFCAAYARKVSNLQKEQTARLESLLARSERTNPLDTLSDLKRIHDSLEQAMPSFPPVPAAEEPQE